jgi:hypothetical protein
VTNIIDQAAWDVGILTQRLAGEYYTHMAALHVAADPRAAAFAPPVEAGQSVPILRVPLDDGTHHIFHFSHFLSQVREPELVDDFKKAWLASTLLTIGDALGVNGYFGHAPEAELVRLCVTESLTKTGSHFTRRSSTPAPASSSTPHTIDATK